MYEYKRVTNKFIRAIDEGQDGNKLEEVQLLTKQEYNWGGSNASAE